MMIEKELVVTELNTDRMESMHRAMNKMLMVEWINADLPNRAWHDVRKSIVLYDESRMFISALKELPDEELLQQIGERTSVRFYSRGV